MRTLSYPGTPYRGKALENRQGSLMPYFPDKGLIQAVEIARFLQRPLLLRGEPGCGKTRLAEALAFEMYPKPEKYEDYYFRWDIKSTTKVQEGIYTFDHLQRLQDIQDSELKNKHKKAHYRKFGPLGEAYQKSTKDKPTILLIDEIDKADIDFPNDLLNELDWHEGKKITIPESEEQLEVEYPPIVIITSNDERELPHAFLRRCVFYYIEFPKNDLEKIAIEYMNSFEENKLGGDRIKELVKQFLNLRANMGSNTVVDKKPSTSELLDWIFTHAYYNLEGAYSNEDKKLQYVEVLLKTEDDFRAQMGQYGDLID